MAGCPGAYALGHQQHGRFSFDNVGRSDSCVRSRLLTHNHLWQFEYFIFKLARDEKAAYELECELWHMFSGQPRNMIHPAAPHRVERRVKSINAKRQVDLDPAVAKLLKGFIGTRTSGFLFQSSNGTPLSVTNVLRRHLHAALNAAFRKQKATEYGVGFELPASIEPNVPKNRMKVNRAKAA